MLQQTSLSSEPKWWQRLARRIASDQRGTVAIIFALTSIPLVLITGMAVDYGRAQHVRSRLQSSVDAAALSGASTILATDAQIQAIVTSNFDLNKPTISYGSTPVPAVTITQDTVAVSASSTVQTTFSRLGGINELEITVTATAGRKIDGTEIVIALDTTGSMGFGNSWDDAKAAMAEMLVELDRIADEQEDFHATFFPFADRVNVGLDRAKTWLSVASPSDSNWGTRTSISNTNKGCLEPRDELIDGNPNALTDKSPTTLAFKPSAKDYWASYLMTKKSYSSCPADEIMGPTTNIGSFQTAIEGLPLKGTGRFDLGMAWAHRLLSPNWQGLWGVTGYPSAYGERRKIAVFMSDAYTESYRWEVPNQITSSNNAVLGFNKGSTKGFENFVDVCNQMKAEGIEVHTIYVNGNGFGVPYMKACATSENGYYHNVTDVSELRDALSKIASSVVAVSLQ